MGKPADRLGELRARLADANLAEKGSYAFRSNEQAAEVAAAVVERWLDERRPRALKLDWDDSALVEALAEILREAETEWRCEPETRLEYGEGQRFVHAAERVIEELQRAATEVKRKTPLDNL